MTAVLSVDSIQIHECADRGSTRTTIRYARSTTRGGPVIFAEQVDERPVRVWRLPFTTRDRDLAAYVRYLWNVTAAGVLPLDMVVPFSDPEETIQVHLESEDDGLSIAYNGYHDVNFSLTLTEQPS